LLPRSTFEEDNKGKIFQRGSNRGAETGSIIVRISKLDYVYFGRFLKWLERLELSSASANVVKEWGISNTSLEQVFIILSESSQTNYRQAANARVNHEEICPLCEANVKEPISFLPFPNNRHLMLPNAICKECHGLPYFLIADEEYSPLLQLSDDESRQIVVSQLFSRAQLLRKNSALNSGQVVDIDEEFSGAIIESSKGSDSSHSQFISESTLAISSELELQSLHHSQMVTQHMHNANEISHDRSKKIRESDLMSITKAMFIKNLQLQSYQRCSTCCVLFLIALMILVVFIMGLLWINPMTCPQGNTVNTFVGETCDIAFQAEYLFHVQNSDNLELHPVIHDVQNIFNISFQVYLSPRLDSSDTEWYFQTTDDYLRTYIQGEFSANNVYGRGDLGLPKYLYRRGTIWANNVETSKEDYESRQSLFFPMNELNGSDFNSNSSEWNEMMFRNQKRNFGDITDGTAFKSSYSFPNCYYSFDMMTNSTGDIQLDYGKYFTDAIFDCQSCALNGGNKSMYFEGTLWVIAIEDSDLYPYAFINFPTPSILQASTASIVEETSSDLKSHSFLRINELIQATDKAKITPDTARDEVCPNNVGAYFPSMYMWDIRNPASVTRTAELTNNTIQAMQFLNILSNSILDPSGKSYLIQGGVSSYSSVAYNYGTSTFLVFLLTMLTVLIMNGIFPMAVWRLSYEKVQTLRLMMNSIGLRDPWYVFSMFLFDLMAMLLINLVVVIIFVQAGLSYFKKVPLGYLIALAILSAYVMASFGFALVRLMPITNSRMTTLLATLMNFALGVAGSLICIINFPQVSSDEGSHETIVWPTALSIIPHFAQVRALWVLLTIGEANQEVSNAFALMFAFGTLCLCMECWMSASWARRDLWEVMQHALCSILIKRQSSQKQLLKQEDEEERQGVQLEELECRDETSNCISTVNNLEGEANHVLEKEDDDVAKERRLIDEIFNVSFDNNSADRGKFAILIRNLYHHFTLDDRAAPLVAVNNLSLGVKFGEVFGLLGPNGAGKSTTLSILCGILRPTDGEVYLAGTRVHQPRDQRNSVLQESLFSSTSMGPAFHRLIGICPQQNVCWENLTVAEHLGFQARLRGVEFNRVSAEVQRVAVLIGLDGDAYCSPAGTLSGGQKRRLSIGMSIIADPPIIFLDEPSAGLDPATRQGLWQLIASLRNPNRCIVLTTHSMEEAETLCSRLGVISEGRLLCVGSSLHFKRKFGTGYTLEVSVDNTPDMQLGVDHEQQVEMDSGEIIDKFILEEIAMNTANDASQLLVSAINLTRKYMIPKDSQHQVTVSEIFMKMEMNKKRLRISQWSISETSLEDIFISLVLKNRKGALE
jgi:ABC-type multidrug transport system ATPase subunit